MRLPFGSMCVLLVVVGCGGVGREHALPVPARPGLLAFRAPLILLPCLFFLFSMSWTGGSFALTVYQVGDVVAPTPTPAPVTPAPVPDTTGGDYTGLGCAEDSLERVRHEKKTGLERMGTSDRRTQRVGGRGDDLETKTRIRTQEIEKRRGRWGGVVLLRGFFLEWPNPRRTRQRLSPA